MTIGANTLLELNKSYDVKSSGSFIYAGSRYAIAFPTCYELEVIPPSGQPEVYTQGAAAWPVGDGLITYTIKLRWPENGSATSVLFDLPNNHSVPQLPADGASQVSVSVPGQTDLEWRIVGPDLGCRLEPSVDTSFAIITAGTDDGTITVEAICNDCGGCVYQGELQLVSCDGCASGGCTDLGTAKISNEALSYQGRPFFHLNLGQDSFHMGAGYIGFDLPASPGPALGSPASLTAPRIGDTVQVISTYDYINSALLMRQVKTRQGLVDIQPDGATSYTMEVFDSTAVGTFQNGVYGILISATPIVTWTIQWNFATKTLGITEHRGGQDREHAFVYDSGSGKWTLTDGGDLATIETWTTVAGAITTRHQQISGSAGPVYRASKSYELFGGKGRIKTIVEGDGAATRTTSYTYQDQQVRQIDYPDGSWEILEYDADKRVSTRYSAFLDQGPTTTAADCRRTAYSYAGLGEGDNGTYQRHVPRETVVSIQGQPVSRSFKVVTPDLSHDIVAASPSAAWDDPENMVTITKLYNTIDFKDGRVEYVTRPDGTASVFSYSQDSVFITTENTGEPTGFPPATIWNGTQTITILRPSGQVESRTVRDRSGGVLGPILSNETRSQWDNLDRPGRVTYLDGTYEETVHGCCGVSATTDRDGVNTTFLYDYLKRPIDTVRLGIISREELDAADKVLVRRRIGTDESNLKLQEFAYDTAGRTVSETNPLNGVTTISEVLNPTTFKLVRTTTYPDGGQKIETHYRDGRLEKVTGTAVYPVRYEYGREADGAGGPMRAFTKEIKLDGSDNPTLEWAKTYEDGAGRAYKTIFNAPSGAPTRLLTFNQKGQLAIDRDPDGVTTLFEYNGEGELEITAIDLNSDGVIDKTGADRISRTVNDVTTHSGAPVRRTERFVWAENSQDSPLRLSTVEVSADGLHTWSTVWNGAQAVVTRTDISYVDRLAGLRTVTVTFPDSTTEVTSYQSGRVSSVVRKDPLSNQIGSTTYDYDPHGRTWHLTDARTGTTTYTYNAADQVTTVTSPVPGSGYSAQTTSTAYNNMLQPTTVTEPDGTTKTHEYWLTGLPRRTYGSRTYPVAYTYDAQGRMTSITTWTTFESAGARVTTWNYDAHRGWLQNKRYPDSTGPDYTYTAGGRLKTRTWARTGTGGQRIATTYTYGFDDGVAGNDHGDLLSAAYGNDPVGTPGMAYTYDRRGRQTTVSRGGITSTLAYNDADQITGESYAGGTLAGLSVTSPVDNLLRRSQVAAKLGSTVLGNTVTYGYDGSRLASVSDGVQTASYGYLANSPWVGQIAFQHNATVRLITSRDFDNLNRLRLISSAATTAVGPVVASSHESQFNNANQRTRTTLREGAYWIYTYDALGQVLSGKKYWADDTPVAGQQFEYAHDDIGNRTSTKMGGDAVGANLRSASYTVNSRNQYESRTVPNAVDVLGVGNTAASITVNGQAVYRKGEYFQVSLGNLANGSAPVYVPITVTENLSGNIVEKEGSLFVPPATEVYAPHDADGNLTQDGRWTYTWDAENRLVQMVANANVPLAAKRKLEFEYDWIGRRIRKTVWTTSDGVNYVNPVATKYLYDGWNLIAELDENNALVRSYIWGLDLSGTLQGAGGVGGLLAVKPASGPAQFVCYDLNGNVTALVDASTGAATAQYEYGPFGEVIRATSAISPAVPIRWSTKYTDLETDLVYYGRRYYNPSTGRWPSRDPIEERGGKNLYAFARNDPIDYIDALGWIPFCNQCKKGDFKLLKAEWLLTPPDWSPEKAENWDSILKDFEDMEKATKIIHLAEGNVFAVAFPAPKLEGQGLFANVLAHLPTVAWGRIKFKICVNVGPRFWLFGSDQWVWSEDWYPPEEKWERSKDYEMGLDAVADHQAFMDSLLQKAIKEYSE